MMDEILLRRLFTEAVERSGAFGAQLSLIKEGQQLDFSAGFAHAGRELYMTTDTLIQIGSITKLFNAAIVLSLVEEGILDLDTAVREYLPTFATANSQASRSVTLRHLLSMSSGLDNGPYVYFGDGADALERYVAHLKSLPQHFRPGEHYGYSNAGTCLAGYIASCLTGKPWETLLWERVLRPAGLSQAAILDEEAHGKSISAGHEPSPTAGTPGIVDPKLTSLRARAPSGPSLAMSMSHLARFGKVLINQGMADNDIRILPTSAVELMMSPQVATPTRKYGDSWCLGPCTGNWNGVRVWGHGGTSATATALIYWIPEQRGVIAFAVNTHAAMGEFSKIAFGEILQAAFGFKKPPIDQPDSESVPLDHRRYVGRYEELGMRMDVVAGEGSTLRAHLTPQVRTQEMGVGRTEQQASLIPLGKDRFLVEPLGGPDHHRGVVDMAFFGDDGTGRATNALNLVFPMSRV